MTHVIQLDYKNGLPVFLSESGTPVKFESFADAVEKMRQLEIKSAEVRTLYDPIPNFPTYRRDRM